LVQRTDAQTDLRWRGGVCDQTSQAASPGRWISL